MHDPLRAMMNDKARADIDQYSRMFSAAQPFRHVVIDDFFAPAVADALLEQFPAFETGDARNEHGTLGNKSTVQRVRTLGPAYAALDDAIQSDDFLDVIGRITGIDNLLYDPDYVGGGTHDNRQSQGLDAHVDFNYHPRTRWHRRLNLIVYLNREWNESWGGSLDLHSNPWDPATDETLSILPLFNRCVIFETTEASWHGFTEITLPEDKRQLTRKSFAIYLYSKERPAHETAPPHATIYVPQFMPSGWKIGRELSEADLLDLQKRFTRIRSQLGYLYEREKHFGAQLEARDHALDEARRAQRLNLQGYATQPTGVRGVWPDDWASAEVSTSFVPTQAVKELTLDLWSPPQLGTDQELRIELDGVAYTQMLRPGMRTPVRLLQRIPAGKEAALTIRSSRTWTPSADGASDDDRALAFRVLGVKLTH